MLVFRKCNGIVDCLCNNSNFNCFGRHREAILTICFADSITIVRNGFNLITLVNSNRKAYIFAYAAPFGCRNGAVFSRRAYVIFFRFKFSKKLFSSVCKSLDLKYIRTVFLLCTRGNICILSICISGECIACFRNYLNFNLVAFDSSDRSCVFRTALG